MIVQLLIVNLFLIEQDRIEQIKRKKEENDELEAELHAIDADLKLKVRMAMNERMEAQNKYVKH